MDSRGTAVELSLAMLLLERRWVVDGRATALMLRAEREIADDRMTCFMMLIR